MHRQNSTWNRQELYERVWQFPLRKLAIEYGISDVGLAKVCRKLEIPLPGLGHWTKIACGHTIERPPLPAMGVDIVTVQKLLGHSTATVTMRYTHSNLDSKKAAVAKLVGFGDNLVTVAPKCSSRNPQLSQMAL